jgi:intein/homing endonuclease
VTPDTLVLTNPKEILTIGDLEGKWKEKEVIGFDEQHKKLITCKIERYKNLSSKKSERKVIKLVTESGRKICATEDHRFYGLQCWIPLDYIKPGDLVAVFPLKDRNANEGYREEEILVTESDLWNTLNRLLTEKSKKPYSKYRYTQQQYINTINLRKRGFTYKEISRRTKLSLRTVIRWLSEGKMPYTVRNPAIEELKQKKLLPLTTKNEKIGAVTRLLGAVFGD